MSAGTITLVSNSAVVTGSDTAFDKAFSTGDMLVATVGGVTYTLPVKSVDSATQATLVRAYDGPAGQGLAWSAVPRDTLATITAQIASDVAYAMRSRINELNNWYQLLEVNGDVVIKLADGSAFTGPSWLRIVDLANTSDLSKVQPLADQIKADREQVSADKQSSAGSAAAAAQSAGNAHVSEMAAAASELAAAGSAGLAAGSATASAQSAAGSEASHQSAKEEADRAQSAREAVESADPTKAVIMRGEFTEARDLNSMGDLATHGGVWSVSDASLVTTVDHFPVDGSDGTGTLEILQGGNYGIIQRYTTSLSRVYTRHLVATWNADNPQWGLWVKHPDSGVNADITGLTGLSGPLKLGADAQGDYDAVTLRQLQAAINAGGSGGPTLNGVMNNQIGAVEWFNGTRAAMWSGYLPSDGQLLNRADYPDLWAAVSNGLLNSVTDPLWINSGDARGAWTNRSLFSTGDGATTFRMPDLNGVYSSDAPSGLFLSGQGNTVSGSYTRTKGIYGQAAPGITATWGSVVGSNYQAQTGGSVIAVNNLSAVTNVLSAGTAQYGYNFDASRSHNTYGKDQGRLYPNHAVGIWVVRARGSFSAVGTNFNVITGDASAPATGTTVYGGEIISNYRAAGANYAQAKFRVKCTIGGALIPELVAMDYRGTSAVTSVWPLPQTPGELVQTGDARLSSVDSKSTGTLHGGTLIVQYDNPANDTWCGYVARGSTIVNSSTSGCFFNGEMNGAARGGLEIINAKNGQFGYEAKINFSRNGGGQADHREAGLVIHADGSTWMVSQPAYGSDEELKTDIEEIPDVWDQVDSVRTVTYVMDGNKQMGIIAQDIKKLWPVAVGTFEKGHYEDGDYKVDGTFLSVTYTYLIAPLFKFAQEAKKHIQALEDKNLALEKLVSDLAGRVAALEAKG